MQAIITKRNADGSYDNVGMENRTVTKQYKTARNLLKFGVPASWRNFGFRIEWFKKFDSYSDPFKVTYHEGR